ncbi:MAG: hypothetical protein N2690_11315, partial [Rhodocyclaceae bacterium]|nr:hypothetical protein [Rhodocyclaceae bacterium]
EMDRRLYSLADLVLLPFRDSHEDIRTVIRDLEMFPRAYAIPTQWPTNAWQREAAERTVAELLAPYRDRILDPVFSLSASKLLLQKKIEAPLPTPLANACRAVAHQVIDLLQLPLEPEAPLAHGMGERAANMPAAPLPQAMAAAA